MKIFKNIKSKFDKTDDNIDYIDGEQIDLQSNENVDKQSFFQKINSGFSFKLGDDRKQSIANKIIEDSDVGKLYWIQLVVACMLATLGLLANSIPVIIGSMLVSPILTPIQSFAFAITCGKRHLYFKSLKILFFSVLIAIPSSFLICYFVPFASITDQVLLRGTPTIVDLAVALLSGVIAFVLLGYENKHESIVGIAIAVSLMPPLASVGIGLHFADYNVAQGSLLLFITNLVGILTVGILLFFLFGFKPSNKSGKKRTRVSLLLVFISICLIIGPLWKSMSQIAMTKELSDSITLISDNYLKSLDEGLILNDISFRVLSNDAVRISAKIDVPSDFVLTSIHKDELTKNLSDGLGKSVELNLDIVELSSVYIDTDTTEKNIISDVSSYLDENDVLLVDYKVLKDTNYYFFFNVYSSSEIDTMKVYDEINSLIFDRYGDGVKIILQWQENPSLSIVEKTEAELNIEQQFYKLFSSGKIINLSLDYIHVLDGDDNYKDQAKIFLEFETPYTIYQTKQILEGWKIVLQNYLGMETVLNTKFQAISVVEF